MDRAERSDCVPRQLETGTGRTPRGPSPTDVYRPRHENLIWTPANPESPGSSCRSRSAKHLFHPQPGRPGMGGGCWASSPRIGRCPSCVPSRSCRPGRGGIEDPIGISSPITGRPVPTSTPSTQPDHTLPRTARFARHAGGTDDRTPAPAQPLTPGCPHADEQMSGHLAQSRRYDAHIARHRAVERLPAEGDD